MYRKSKDSLSLIGKLLKTEGKLPPNQPWQKTFAHRAWVGLLVACSTLLFSTMVMAANSAPVYQPRPDSADPAIVTPGNSVLFNSSWSDPDNNYVVDGVVRFRLQGTTQWEEFEMGYTGGINPFNFSGRSDRFTVPGTYEYQFQASDSTTITIGLLHTTAWIAGGTFQVGDAITPSSVPAGLIASVDATPPTPLPSTSTTISTTIEKECGKPLLSKKGVNLYECPSRKVIKKVVDKVSKKEKVVTVTVIDYVQEIKLNEGAHLKLLHGEVVYDLEGDNVDKNGQKDGRAYYKMGFKRRLPEFIWSSEWYSKDDKSRHFSIVNGALYNDAGEAKAGQVTFMEDGEKRTDPGFGDKYGCSPLRDCVTQPYKAGLSFPYINRLHTPEIIVTLPELRNTKTKQDEAPPWMLLYNSGWDGTNATGDYAKLLIYDDHAALELIPKQFNKWNQFVDFSQVELSQQMDQKQANQKPADQILFSYSIDVEDGNLQMGVSTPRTVLGVADEGKTVVILSTMGQFGEITAGMTREEVKVRFKKFGISENQLLVLDAGGSTKLYAKDDKKGGVPYPFIEQGRYVPQFIGVLSGECGGFEDVNGGDEDLCKALMFLVDKGIASPNRQFKPNDKLTREQMATFLMRVYCSVRNDDPKCPASKSHSENIESLIKLGLTSAKNSTAFKGTAFLTRDEMAKFLSTLWHSLAGGQTLSACQKKDGKYNLHFEDITPLDSIPKLRDNAVFCPHIEELATLGIATGKVDKPSSCQPISWTGWTYTLFEDYSDKKSYCPKDAVLRSEMAKFLYRMFHVDKNVDSLPDISQNNVSSGLSVNGELVAIQVNKANSSQRSSDSREVGCPPQNFSLKKVSELDNTFSDEEFPQGIIEFETPCEAVEVTLFYHGVDMNNPDSASEFRNRIYRTYGLLSPNDPSAKGWSILPNVTIGQATIDEQEVGTVSFILQDGEVGDEIGADGKIVHKGGIAVANNTLTEVLPAQCLLYGVYDQGLNNSQFFVVNPQNEGVTPLGNLCQGCDIEAMDVQPFTNILYAASGNKTEFNHPKGHLYQVDAQRGQLVSIGETGFEKISSLAFDATGTLWGWAAGEGLIQIDTETGKGTLFLASQAEVEDLTWNLAGTMLYGAIGKELWAYEAATGNITKLCDNLPLKTEGIKILPDMMLPDDFLMLGMHQDKTLKLHAFDVKMCELVISKDIPIPYDDVEGLTMPKAVCVP